MVKNIPNAEVAFIQNGRNVTWKEVTTQDLFVNVHQCKPDSDCAKYSKLELDRRRLDYTWLASV